MMSSYYKNNETAYYIRKKLVEISRIKGGHDMNKKMLLIVGILLIVCLGIGGKMYMDKKRLQEEMLQVVTSDDADTVYKRTIKNIDPDAFTDQGIIQSYKVDYDSIQANPMGGIMVNLIINGNPDLLINNILEKNYDTNELRNGWGDESKELTKLLKK